MQYKIETEFFEEPISTYRLWPVPCCRWLSHVRTGWCAYLAARVLGSITRVNIIPSITCVQSAFISA